MKRLLITMCVALAAFTHPVAAQEPNNDKSIQKLRLAKFVMPEFPSYVQLTGNNRGVVTVAIGRNTEGNVTDVLVLDSTHPRLSQSVVEAVSNWKFVYPANPPPTGQEIVPIVRFLFTAKGISIVSALTGSLASKDRDVNENSPVILPSFAELDTLPKPINHPMPRFTGSLAAGAADSSVTVKFFVDETGKVRVPIIVDCSVPELGRAALAAVEQWRYDPPLMGGHATIALEIQTFNFAPPQRP
jgi:TonB family protein